LLEKSELMKNRDFGKDIGKCIKKHTGILKIFLIFKIGGLNDKFIGKENKRKIFEELAVNQ